MKVKIFLVPGKTRLNNNYLQSVMMDDDFVFVDAHVDDQTYKKILEGKFVDFNKLIPCDQVAVKEDNRVELFMKGGHTYCGPPSESTLITNFHRWEQAFRVFYIKAHPDKAAELVEYNHVIHTISQTFTWDNVYLYDRDFRIHMSKNPTRSWTVILQHSWSLRLKDRLHQNDGSQGSHQYGGQNFNQSSGTNQGGQNRGRLREPCRKFNKGRCPHGTTRKFEHHCSYCYKLGHNLMVCQKFAADKDRGGREKQDRRSDNN